MKRIFALFLAVVMIFSMAACSSGGGGGGGSSGGGGRKKATSVDAVLEVMNKLQNGDSSQIMMTAPDEVWERWEENAEDYDEQLKALKDSIEEGYASVQSHFGEGVTFSISIEEQETFSDDELESLKKRLEKEYLIDPEDVTEGYRLHLLITMEPGETDKDDKDEDEDDNEDKKVMTQTTSGYVCKIGKYWYPINIDSYPDMSAAEFMFPIDARIKPSATGITLEEAVEIAEELVSGDTSRLEDAYPEAFIEYTEQNGDDTDFLAIPKNSFQELHKMRKYSFGDDYTTVVTITDQQFLSDYELEEVAYNIEQYYGIDSDDLLNACYITVTYQFSGNKGSDSGTEQWTAIQIGDNWYISDFITDFYS